MPALRLKVTQAAQHALFEILKAVTGAPIGPSYLWPDAAVDRSLQVQGMSRKAVTEWRGEVFLDVLTCLDDNLWPSWL